MEIKTGMTWISKETAKVLYSKGITKAEQYYYDKETEGVYPKFYQDEVRTWLREEYELQITIIHLERNLHAATIKSPYMGKSRRTSGADTYQNCLEKSILEGLKVV